MRYQKVIHPKATSDDEADTTGVKVNHQTVHWIKRRPERSAAAESFIRRLDELREQSARYSSKKKWNERPRRVPSTGQNVSTFLKLPENMPIDYFDPSFYNNLLPRLRFSIAEPYIVFLPDGQAPLAGVADETLTKNRFNKKYGPDVLSRYKLVTEDDFADEDDEDDEDEMDYDVEEDEVDNQDDIYHPDQSEEDEEEVQQGMETEEDWEDNRMATEGDGDGNGSESGFVQHRGGNESDLGSVQLGGGNGSQSGFVQRGEGDGSHSGSIRRGGGNASQLVQRTKKRRHSSILPQ